MPRAALQPPSEGDLRRARTAAGGAAVLFAVTVAGCTLARHDHAVVTDGLSWFGAHRPTAAPFVLAMICVSGLLLTSARSYPVNGMEAVVARRTIGAVAVLLLVVLATPYTVDAAFNWTHMIAGGLLFGTQFLLTVRLWLRSRDRNPNRNGNRNPNPNRSHAISVLALAQLVAGLAALASLVGLVDVLLYAQIVFQLMFLAELPVLLTAQPDGR